MRAADTLEAAVAFAVDGQKGGLVVDEIDTAGRRFTNLDVCIRETAVILTGMFLSSITTYTDRTMMVGRTP